MATTSARKRSRNQVWPRKISFGRVIATIYRRLMPSGGWGYRVENYTSGKRRFDSYATEAEALEAAHRLARQLSERKVMAASMTNAQAAEYAAAVQSLKPFGVSLIAGADGLAKCLESLGDMAGLYAAVKFYTARNRQLTRKRVADVVADLLVVKQSGDGSPRYITDLHSRLGRFARDFQKDCCDITTAEVQHWLDGLNVSSQSYQNYQRVVSLLFQFAVARGYAVDNPVKSTERRKVKGGETLIYTPQEIRKLLAAASVDFLPFVAIGAFAGIRVSEIVRLEWADVRLADLHIVIGKSKAKTASRRIVPICDALAAWLMPYAERSGLVWKTQNKYLPKTQRITAEIAGVPWHQNALRHSFGSYRLAQIGNVESVAHEMGNTPKIVHQRYVKLVTPSDAKKWFNVKPEGDAANILPMTASKE